MSAKPESRLWKTLRDGLTDVHWTRIESWASPGVPDVNGCAEFGEFWIELKVSVFLYKKKKAKAKAGGGGRDIGGVKQGMESN